MSTGFRHYLVTDYGLKRLSKRLIDGLVHGEDALPEFAETSQRVATVVIDFDGLKPKKLLQIRGSIWHFDEQGKCQLSIQQRTMEAVATHRRLKQAETTSDGSVIDITAKLDRKQWEEKYRWEPGKKDCDAIEADLFGSALVRKQAANLKGVKIKAPPMTYEAKHALAEIEKSIRQMDGHLEELSEPALKAVAFEARRLASSERNSAYLSVAERSDRKREILARHRTGKGKWVAYIESIIWEGVQKKMGRSGGILAKAECESKAEAEEAARRLLAENAKHLSAYVEIDARIETDLEFYEFDGPDED